MTKISQIRDALQTMIASVLPSAYVAIPNPYVPDQNSQLTLQKGFGIGVGPGEPARLEICPKYGMARRFSVVLVNLVTSMVSDQVKFQTVEEGMLEDFHAIRKKLETEVTLGNVCIKNDYEGDSGITFLSSEKFKFISLSADFVVIYREDLSE